MSNQNEGKKAEKTGSVDRMLETKTIHDDRESRKKQRHSEMRARFEALQSIEGNRGQETGAAIGIVAESYRTYRRLGNSRMLSIQMICGTGAFVGMLWAAIEGVGKENQPAQKGIATTLIISGCLLIGAGIVHGLRRWAGSKWRFGKEVSEGIKKVDEISRRM